MRRFRDEYRLTLANFSWNFIGNTVYAGAQWIVLMSLAKSLDAVGVGEYTLALSITAPIVLFTNMQLRNIQATDVNGEYSFSEYLSLRIICTLLGLLVMAALCVKGHYAFASATIVLTVGFAKSVEAVSDVIYGLIQKHEDMQYVGKSLLFKSGLLVVALAGCILFTRNLIEAVIVQAVSWLLLLAFYDFRNAKKFVSLRLKPNLKLVRDLLKRSLPLGIVTALISLNTNIPRYFISYYLGNKALGYFGALAYILVIGNTFVTALGQSISPRLSRHFAVRDSGAYIRTLVFLCVCGVAVGVIPIILSLFWGRTILTLLYRSDYASYADVLVRILVSAGLGYVASCLGYAMTAARRFGIQLFVFFGSTVGCIAASYALIKRYGLLGAADALVITAWIQLLCGLVVVVLLCIPLVKSSHKKVDLEPQESRY